MTIGALLALLFVLLNIFTPSAFAASTRESLQDCNALEVKLNGKQSPTYHCLSKEMQPAIFGRKCVNDGNDLVLYWNGPLYPPSTIPPGPILCVRGAGVLNLNQTFPDGHNWNDQASAWWAGCSAGAFYVDINEGGGAAYFSGGSGTSAPSANFPYGGVGNDQLSSIRLYSDC